MRTRRHEVESFGRGQGTAQLSLGDALDHYEQWPPPDVIISDGPYGLRSFPGDPAEVGGLVELYEPYAEVWAKCAKPSTTLVGNPHPHAREPEPSVEKAELVGA